MCFLINIEEIWSYEKDSHGRKKPFEDSDGREKPTVDVKSRNISK